MSGRGSRKGIKLLFASLAGLIITLSGMDANGAFAVHVSGTGAPMCAARTMMINPCATLDPSNIDDLRRED